MQFLSVIYILYIKDIKSIDYIFWSSNEANKKS